MRCARCGNENLEGNRFCGMCGATLLTATIPVASTPSQNAGTRSSALSTPAPSAPAQPKTTPSSRTSAPVSEREPSISGPSFLGLNNPPPRKRASLSTDPYTTPHSRNLDYLLEDEEAPHRGGAGKFVLILLALALAVGFGYLRWKNQGFGWLGLHLSKPSAAAQNPEPPDTNPTTPAAAGNPTPTSSTTAQTAAQPAADIVAQPAPAANAPASSTAPISEAAPANPAPGTTPPGKATAPTDTGGAKGTENSSEDAAAATDAANTKESGTKEFATTAADSPPATIPKPSKPVRQPKPSAAKPTAAADPVAEARKYLYGRGAAQDCERGLRLLKPAANQANPKAMIEMGALYSAGLCTPHDLPTAYRWFALALRKDPENQAVQTDLQKLWSEMTQPERQLAIKLSQ